ELLTGRLPYRGATADEWLEQIRKREPRPPRTVDDTLPRELERICLKCLAKAAADRYPTARDLAEELRRWEEAPGAGPAAAADAWAGRLRTLDFRAERARLRQDFVGRAWLDAELRRWLGQGDGRVFLVTGDPGAGKSAYLAHVADRHPEALAHHFCVAGLA